MAERLVNWELRLQKVLNDWETRKFKWGESDCVHFAGACLEAITGEDPLEDLAVYSNEAEALSLIENLGGSLRKAVDIILNVQSADNAPDKGDLVLAERTIRGRTGPGLGICLGPHCAFVGRKRLERIPTNDCLCSWEIPS